MTKAEIAELIKTTWEGDPKSGLIGAPEGSTPAEMILALCSAIAEGISSEATSSVPRWQKQAWAAPATGPFTLLKTPVDGESLFVLLNGQLLEDGVDYTRTGKTVALLGGPLLGNDRLVARYATMET